MVISVAVCEQPAGKYTFYGHVKGGWACDRVNTGR